MYNSGWEDGYSRLGGAGFSGAGGMSEEVARQKSRVYLRAKLTNSLKCYLEEKRIKACPERSAELLLKLCRRMGILEKLNF